MFHPRLVVAGITAIVFTACNVTAISGVDAPAAEPSPITDSGANAALTIGASPLSWDYRIAKVITTSSQRTPGTPRPPASRARGTRARA